MTLSAFLQAPSLPSKVVVQVSRLYAIVTIEPLYRNFGKLMTVTLPLPWQL